MKNSQKLLSAALFGRKELATAALATLKAMKTIKSWKIIDNKGKLIIKNWMSLSKKYNLPIEISGTFSLFF